MKITVVFLFLFIFCFSTRLFAQETKINEERPKVGLCLSGGGARGMAHIGVLKVIDEVGLPIDYITGVSMGSIVGGMYAMGYSADSIFNIFKQQNWEILLSDQITEKNVIIDEKSRYNNYLFEIGYRDKEFELPTGLLPGQQISTMMSTICWDAYQATDFDSLPIPYMAVSADLASCTAIKMDSGHLPEIMRSSMAIPTVFTPVDYDSLLLVDGGLVRNIAVDEVIDMGADIVIGSYTGRHLYKKKDLENSITNMIGQLSSFAGLFDAEEQKKKIDILIQPEYEDISPTDFNSINLIVDRGYRAALRHKKELQALADSLNAIAPAKEKKKLKHHSVIKFNEIRIEGNHIYPDYQIKRILEIEPGYIVSAKTLAEKMDLLYATNYFHTVSYKITEENNKLILYIRCKEKPSTNIRGSIHYDTYSQAGINLHGMTRNFIFNRSRFTLDAYVSEYYRTNFNYLKFLGKKQRLGFYINVFSSKDDIPSYFDDFNERAEAFQINTNYSNIGLEYLTGSNSKIELGLEYQFLNLKPQLYNPTIFKYLRIQNLKPFIAFKQNSFDNKHFPRSGSSLDFEVYMNKPLQIKEKNDSSSIKYQSNGVYNFDWTLNSRCRYRKMFYITKYLSIEMQLNYALSSDRNMQVNDFTLIGGEELKNRWGLPMSGLSIHEIVIKNALGGGFGISTKLGERFYIENRNFGYVINNDIESDDYEYLYGTSLSFGYNSRIGPIKLSLQHGDFINKDIIRDLTIYFTMGYNF